MKNIDRGIKYITLNLEQVKLFIFINGSFTNNKNFSSYTSYLIILINKTKGTDEFAIKGNLIHYSSIKSKRVTKSILAFKIYKIVRGVNIAIAINIIIKMIIRKLGFLQTLIIVCTDLYLLYKYLVKLSTTKEKRLIINIMALYQLYKRREIIKIQWINRKDNPANTITKSTPNKALGEFVDFNQLSI